MKDRVLFFAMIGVIGLLTFIHKVEIFLFLAIVFIFFSYKIAIKSLWAILFFNLSITLGYIFESFFTGKNVFDYLKYCLKEHIDYYLFDFLKQNVFD